MKKISPNALAAALAVTRISESFIAPCTENGCNTGDAFLAILLSAVLTVLLFLPLYFVCKKYGGEDFLSAASKRSAALSKLLSLLFLIAVTAYACETLIDLQHFISDTVFPSMIFITGAVLTGATALYGALKKAPALSRASVFAAAVLGILFVIVVATNFISLDPIQLYLSFISDTDAFAKRLLYEISANSQVMIFAILSAETKSPEKALLPFLIITPIVLLLLTILYGMMLGNYLGSSEYPLYIISSLADISIFRRMDGFFAIVTIISCVIKLSLLIYCAKKCFDHLSEKQTAAPSLAAYTAAVVAASWFFGTEIPRKEAFSAVINSAVPLIFAGMLLPLISLIFGRRKKEEKKDV